MAAAGLWVRAGLASDDSGTITACIVSRARRRGVRDSFSSSCGLNSVPVAFSVAGSNYIDKHMETEKKRKIDCKPTISE